MKKIKFILQNENEVLFEEILEYKKEDDYYTFNMDKYLFKIMCNENHFDFIRETKEDIFNLTNKEINKGIITIKKPHNIFDLPIENIDYTYSLNDLSITYKLVDDDINRIIKISFINDWNSIDITKNLWHNF